MLLLEGAQDARGELPRGGRGARRGRVAARGRNHVRGLEGAAVGQGDALRVGWRLSIGKPLAVHGRRGLGVVELLEVRPDLPSNTGAEAVLRRLERLGESELPAAALAEDPRDQRGDRDHIGDLPLVPRQADALRGVDQVVLAGQLGRIGAGLRDVLVDPGYVVVDVLLELHSLLSVEARGTVVLNLEVGLAVWRVGPDRLVHRGIGAAGERRKLGASRVAQGVDHEQPVLGRDVARPEHRPGARRAVDVRDVVGVSLDGDVTSRAVRPDHVGGLGPEARVLVEVPDLRSLKAGRRVHQIRVHVELPAARIGRECAVGLEGGDLGGVRVRPLGGRQDVSEVAVVVVLVRARRGSCTRGARPDGEQRDGHDSDDAQAPETPQDCFLLGPAERRAGGWARLAEPSIYTARRALRRFTEPRSGLFACPKARDTLPVGRARMAR